MKPTPESDSDLQSTNEQPMNTTNEQNGPFDWYEFPEGRARFVGGIRGADQNGHEVIAVDLSGDVNYGEIRKSWIDEFSFNLEIVSFGHQWKENIGIEISRKNPLVSNFSKYELERIKDIISGLVKHFESIDNDSRPFVMWLLDGSRNAGELIFSDTWAILSNEEGFAP